MSVMGRRGNAVHLIKCCCVLLISFTLVTSSMCRQQNIEVLMCSGITLLDAHLSAVEEKVHLAYSFTAVVFL